MRRIQRRATTELRLEALEPRTLLTADVLPKVDLQRDLGPTNSLIVRFADHVSAATRAVLDQLGAQVAEAWASGSSLLALGAGVDPAAARERLRVLPEVVYAETNSPIRVSSIPNDPFFGQQWGLDQANDFDIDAPHAWDVTTGNPATIVAVTDTGVDYTHPDL